jgi:hypothetical protein
MHDRNYIAVEARIEVCSNPAVPKKGGATLRGHQKVAVGRFLLEA